MKVIQKKTGKEYHYDYINVFFKGDVANKFKETAKKEKKTNTQFLQYLLENFNNG